MSILDVSDLQQQDCRSSKPPLQTPNPPLSLFPIDPHAVKQNTPPPRATHAHLLIDPRRTRTRTRARGPTRPLLQHLQRRPPFPPPLLLPLHRPVPALNQQTCNAPAQIRLESCQHEDEDERDEEAESEEQEEDCFFAVHVAPGGLCGHHGEGLDGDGWTQRRLERGRVMAGVATVALGAYAPLFHKALTALGLGRWCGWKGGVKLLLLLLLLLLMVVMRWCLPSNADTHLKCKGAPPRVTSQCQMDASAMWHLWHLSGVCNAFHPRPCFGLIERRRTGYGF
ncbi:hypothetical protein SVAN01_09702 [Stagonosporopsis vannaccii]|nr:hypothetical protein SVAN01_09702 [Stagonosporopsis vannaccii]